MGKAKREAIKEQYDFNRIAKSLDYWIAWYLKREREMMTKGYERFLNDEKLEKLVYDQRSIPMMHGPVRK